VLGLAAAAEDPRLPRAERFRWKEREAILRGVLGDAGAAADCAALAPGFLGPPDEADPVLLAENLILRADLLRRAGRPAAAAEALDRAAELAAGAGAALLVRAARRDP
jgi:hypothetical protein